MDSERSRCRRWRRDRRWNWREYRHRVSNLLSRN